MGKASARLVQRKVCCRRTAFVPKVVHSMTKTPSFAKVRKAFVLRERREFTLTGETMVTKNCSVKPSLNENPFRGTWDEIVGVPFVSLTRMKDGIYYFVSPAAAWDLNLSRLCRRRIGDENQCYAVLHWLDVDSKNAYTGGNMGGRKKPILRSLKNRRKLTRLLLTRCPSKLGCRGEPCGGPIVH